MTVRSNASKLLRETGMITVDDRTNGWNQATGILCFEPIDNAGNMNKAVQIRGNLPDRL